MEHVNPPSPSKWIDVAWEPNAQIYVMPDGLEIMDISGQGDHRLVAADLGIEELDDPKLKIYDAAASLVSEHKLRDLPSAIVGFHTENGERRSGVLAVAAASCVLIFKNLRPYFKYTLPYLIVHPQEQEIWQKAALEDELNVLNLADALAALLETAGAAYLTPRTLNFLKLDKEQKHAFAETCRREPLIKCNTVTTLASIQKDYWNEPACHFLVIGTQSGEIFVMDPRAFYVTEKFAIGWPPVTFTTSGLWMGDGQVVIAGRDGEIGVIRRGETYKPWQSLIAPIVAMAPLMNDGAAVVTMDSAYYGFSKQGSLLWKITLPGSPLDMISLSVPESGLSLLAISLREVGVWIYDDKHHVDTIKIMESVSTLKYGRLGQEDRTLAMVTIAGGLCIKILKRTADFSKRINPLPHRNSDAAAKFSIPKKTKLFIEQTVRERAEAQKMYATYQQGLLRLRLEAARKARDLLENKNDSTPNAISMEASVLGLGPNYVIKIHLTNLHSSLSESGLYLIFRDENATTMPRMLNLPLLMSGICLPISVTAVMKGRLPGKVKILLCSSKKIEPIIIKSVILPVAEEDIEI